MTGSVFSGEDQGVPYVTWQENNILGINLIYVKHWNGTTWELDGGPLNADYSMEANAPTLVSNGTTPYVAWSEKNSAGVFQVYVKHWNGSTWVLDGGSLNIDPTKIAQYISITFNASGTTPYVAWDEPNFAGITQVYVKALE